MVKRIESIGVSTLYVLLFIGSQIAANVLAMSVIWLWCSLQNNLIDISRSILDIISNNALFLSIFGNLLFLCTIFVIQRKKQIVINFKMDVNSLSCSYFKWALFSIICFSLMWNGIFAAFPALQSIPVMDTMVQGNWLVYILAIYVFAPITEELCFREIILPKLLQNLSTISAIIISATLFASVHLMTGSFITVLFAFIGGVIFAACYSLTKSLTATIIVHIAGNLCEFVWYLITQTSITIQLIILVAVSCGTLFLLWILIKEVVKG
ncbi:MAG: lysostaphin resistance A-like protein [Beduini sp.]|uniref:CPBP family intramembrane glutamic endopeptidase n=1 Tax=Beduini sp. TaxID=1922300 RepID=UPI0011C7D771